MEPYWHIRGSGLLKRWMADLRAHGRLRRWGHRAEIDHSGVGAVHLVITGSVQVEGENGLVRLNRGDLWGVNQPELSLRAFDDTTVLDLSEEELTENLGEMNAKVGVLKPRTVSMPICDLIRQADEARVLKVLLHVAPDQLDDGAKMIEVEIRARHISQLTGLPIARTRAVLQALQSSELLEVGRRGLVIPDVTAIRAVLEAEE